MSTVTVHHRKGSRQNAKAWANKFIARILEPGIVSYEDQDCGTALLQKETLDRCMNSFIGRPLILTRDDLNRPTYKHAKVTPRTMENQAVGYISDVKYNDTDGWWYAEGIVHDDDAKRAIKEVGYVSCAYDVLETAPGGSYHNLPYHEEITNFEGEHLAIVDNPRYETATIRLNSKPKQQSTMIIKWIKNKLAPSKTAEPVSKENSVTEDIAHDAALEIDGVAVPVTEVAAAYQRLNSKDGETIDASSEIEVGGDRVTLGALISCYNAKKNAEEKEEEKKENEKEAPPEKKENAEDDEDDKKEKKKENAEDEKDEDKKEKKNSVRKVFRVNNSAGPVSRARENGITFDTSDKMPETMDVRLNRGADRYGPIKNKK